MQKRVIIDPNIQHGKPIIKGTRVPIIRIIDGLAYDMKKEEIMKEYEISEKDIQAALIYAGELIAKEEFHILPTFSEAN